VLEGSIKGVSSPPGPEGDAGLLPRALHLVFHSVGERVSPHMGVKPQYCRDYSLLTREQQAGEALAKRNLLRQLKEVRRLPVVPPVSGTRLTAARLSLSPENGSKRRGTRLSLCVSVCRSTCLPACVSVYLSVCLPA